MKVERRGKEICDEKRRFRRIRRETPVTVISGNKEFQLRLFDYTPFGVRIKAGSIFSPGEPVELIIDNYHLNGRIVWVSPDYTGISIDGPVAGDLGIYRLWDLLIGLRRAQKTGILEITSGEIKKSIYIRSGEPVFARSNIEDERLGEFLLKKGLITLDAYHHSVELMKKTGKRQGAVLVEAGYLKAEDLPKVVMAQIEEIIKNTFKLLKGTFEFKEGPLPTNEIITLRLSLANLIFRGIKGINSFQFIRSELDNLDARPVPSRDPYHLFQEISLDDNERRILFLVDGKNRINDIIKKSGLNHFETLKILYGLLSTRIIELKKDEVSEEEGISVEEILKESGVTQEFLREVEELYKRCDLMSHYEILGVTDQTDERELKRIYYRLVKKFHPDRYYRIGHDELKDKLSKIFARINHAYTVLSDKIKKREYDDQLSKTLHTADTATEKFEKGFEFYMKKDYNNAATFFGQAVYLDSLKPKYHFYYGLALKETGRYKEAEKAFLKAIELWPQNADYVAELGYLYLGLEMKLRAKRTFEKALSIDPENRKAREGLKLSSE